MLNDLGIDIVLDTTTLAPGATTTGTDKYTVTAADVEAGKVYNKATTTGTPPDDGDPNTPPLTPPTDDDDDEVPGTPVETTEETTIVEESTEAPVDPADPSGDVTLYKKEAGADKYLDHAIFDLYQTSKFIDVIVNDQTSSQEFSSVAVDILRDGQVVKADFTATSDSEFEATESGNYSLRMETSDKFEVSYELNSNSNGFVITIKDKEVESTEEVTQVESTQAVSVEEVTQDSALLGQIEELQATIESMRANTPSLVESTELVAGEPVVITPESTNEDGSFNPEVTSVEMISQVVDSNKAEIDAHNAEIASLEAQLATLQEQLNETSTASVTVEASQVDTTVATTEEVTQLVESESSSLSIDFSSKIGQYETTKGHIAVDGLSKGKYYFIEIKAPTGYIVDTTTKHTFEIVGNDEDTVVLTAENVLEVPKDTTEEPKESTEVPEETTDDPKDKPSKPSTGTPGSGGPSGGGSPKGGGSLPQTGESVNTFLLLMSFVSMGSGLVLMKRKF